MVGTEVGVAVGFDEVGNTLGESVGTEVVGIAVVGATVPADEVGDVRGDSVGVRVRVGHPLLVALNRRQDRPPC